MSLTQVPLRLATGAYIVNSGISKLGADDGTVQFLHGAAASTYPALFKDMEAAKFARLLAVSEISVWAPSGDTSMPPQFTVRGVGLASGIAVWSFYVALSRGPMSVISPITRCS